MFNRNKHKHTNNILNAENNPTRLHPAGSLAGSSGRAKQWAVVPEGAEIREGDMGIVFGASVILTVQMYL